jgi:tetratricopeptide (TPR) repeat protein
VLGRFLGEAQLAGQLQHPGVVPVYELGRLDDGRPFFAMKLIHGRTLADLLAERTSPGDDLPRFLRHFETICQTVGYAHSRGVIHRDLKPGNVMVGAFGEVQVMDWGLAKVLASEERPRPEQTPAPPVAHASGSPAQSQTGAVLGTPGYMAPEQARGQTEQVDTRSDVFGLGAILCEILTGQPPFCGPTSQDVLLQAHQAALTDAWARLDGCGADRELVRLARDCLAPGRDERPACGAVVAERVGAYLAGVQERLRRAEVGQARAETRAEGERKRRRLALALAAAVLLLAVAGGSGAWLVQQQRAAALAHQREHDHKILTALERGRSLLEQGWQANELDLLKEARAEAGRAGMLASSGAASVAAQLEATAFAAEAEERWRRAQKNRALLEALLDMSDTRESHAFTADDSGRTVVARPSMDDPFAVAFRRWGMDVDASTDEEVVARVNDEPAPVREEIIAGLDAWWQKRRLRRRPEAEWRRLLRLAAKLDHTDWRRPWRAALGGAFLPYPQGKAGLAVALAGAGQPWTTLAELASHRPAWLLELRGQGKPATDPVQSVVLLANLCQAAGDRAGAEEVLRQALAARPDQVVLLDALGQLLELQGPARLGEATECYRAIRARQPRLGVGLVRTLRRAGRGAEGIAVLRDLLRYHPDNPGMHFALAFVLSEQNRWAEAVSVWHKVIQLAPGFAEAHNNLGICLRNLNRPQEAESAARRALAFHPDYGNAWNNLATALLEQKKVAEAEAAFRKAFQLQPNDSATCTSLGNVLADQNSLDEAETMYRRAIRLRPEYAPAHIGLGNVLYKRKKLREAVAAYQTAIQFAPGFAEAWYYLGNVQEARKERDQALAAWRKAIQLRPAFPQAHRSVGLALQRDGRPGEAEAAFRKALEMDPTSAQTWDNLGNALLEQKKLVEAVAAYQKAIQLHPKHALAYFNMGCALRALNRRREAVAAWQEAIRYKPDFAVAYTNFGAGLRELGEVNEAVKAYQKALQLRPDDALTWYHLGCALRDQKKLDEAVEVFRQAIARKRDFVEAYGNLAAVLAQQKRLGEAVAAFRQCLQLKPDLTEARLNLVITLTLLARFAEALAELKMGRDLLPEHHPRRNELEQWMRRCRRQRDLDARLPAMLKGTDRPASAAEQIEFAWLCALRKFYGNAARFFRDAFAADPKRAEAVSSGLRFNAACCAVLAARGCGKDMDQPDDRERALWRRQALDWLRADLAWWNKALAVGDARTTALVLGRMRHWESVSDLASVRDRAALDKLPEPEGNEWHKFWADVKALLARASRR